MTYITHIYLIFSLCIKGYALSCYICISRIEYFSFYLISRLCSYCRNRIHYLNKGIIAPIVGLINRIEVGSPCRHIGIISKVRYVPTAIVNLWSIIINGRCSIKEIITCTAIVAYIGGIDLKVIP